MGGWESLPAAGGNTAHVAVKTPTLPNAQSVPPGRLRDEQGAEELAGAGVQGAEPPDRGSGGCPPRFRRPGREPSPKAACDVAEASRDFSSSLLDALEVRGAIH